VDRESGDGGSDGERVLRHSDLHLKLNHTISRIADVLHRSQVSRDRGHVLFRVFTGWLGLQKNSNRFSWSETRF